MNDKQLLCRNYRFEINDQLRRLIPNISAIENYYDRGRFLLAWRISIAFCVVFFMLTLIYSLSSATAVIPTGLTFGITVFCLIYLSITKNFKLIFWVYAISGTLLANFALNYVLDFTHYVDFVWIIASILLAFVGLGWMYGVLFIILNCIGIAYFFWFTLNKHIEILQPKSNTELIGDYLEILFSFFVIAYLMRLFILYQRYSELSLKKANLHLANQNQLIRSKITENQTLMKEIHHRVKNNLQIIISLLRMQRAELQSEESKTQFSEAINRIMSMSLIHQKLYGSQELSKVDLKSYIEELVYEITAISFGKDKIKLDVVTNVNAMNLDTVVPLGLLINELVSNSLKHGFNNESEGQIRVKVVQQGDEYAFSYSDNGTWKGFAKDKSSFGFELIDLLTEQMNGSKILNIENGTHYDFILKETVHNN